jgi:aryl-alcohol dehydrogenase-like predicted oxidoreductase
LAASLDRLGQSRVELYQLHFPVPVLSNRTWLLDVAGAQRDGLVGAVGVSNYGPRNLRAAHRVLADLGVRLATNQVEYSLLARRPERSGLVELCAELGVTIIAYSPLAQGLLTGKYSPANPPPGIRGLRYRRRRLAALAPLIERLTAIGAEHGGRTPGQVALNWLITQGALPIPGAKTAAQAHHNAGGAGWSLSLAEIAELSASGGR